MGNVIITRRFGSGSLKSTDALLRVIAPANSVVTITKDGKTKGVDGHENADDNTLFVYYFIIPASKFDSNNPWTVSATLGNNFSSKSIIIDSAKEYSVGLNPVVPSEYQAVEYLQSSGTQYINLGINPINTSWGFDIDVMPLNAMNVGAALFGQKPANSNEWHLNCWNGGSGYNGTLIMYSSNYAAKMTQNVRVQLSLHNRVFTNAVGTTTTIVDKTVGNLPLYLFACNYNGSVAEKASMRLYSFKLYDATDTLVADIRPCYRVSDSVAGVWDNQRSMFLINNGTGDFTVGADVT